MERKLAGKRMDIGGMVNGGMGCYKGWRLHARERAAWRMVLEGHMQGSWLHERRIWETAFKKLEDMAVGRYSKHSKHSTRHTTTKMRDN